MFERNSQFTVIKLENNQVFRLPKAYRDVQVLSGTAWITVDKQDIILRTGDKVSLPSSNNFAVISVLTKVPLILEVLTDERKPITNQFTDRLTVVR
ncbi:hypothetical protein [Kamptonema sp. UHCC 0994]|uniref:hypothetical protein n=1 Tax=Kamptonema sp. UHCC 0994 TaxID=3031329 RepID=UPI0023BAD7DB|nr:hypothetical protein [Kamptonema sp. UHCC 0994]MDF0556924.1 hypothetical protein [Kamptonema sp. UHCC 0994]